MKFQIRADPSDPLDPRSKNVNIENFYGTRSDPPALEGRRVFQDRPSAHTGVQTNLNSPKAAGTWKFGVSAKVGDHER